MNYWLMKSEPGDFSIDDLKRAAKKTTPWFGVRNYQARNFMRDQMRRSGILYHSSCEVPGIAGIVEISSLLIPMPPSSTTRANISTPSQNATTRAGSTSMSSWSENPARAACGAARVSALARMQLLQRGNRLSITPVEPAEWKFILGILSAATRYSCRT
jgi:predicted RNA-binding protein with PUA-like domain